MAIVASATAEAVNNGPSDISAGSLVFAAAMTLVLAIHSSVPTQPDTN